MSPHTLFDRSLKFQDEVTDALGEQVRRADELRHPILLIHSLDDEFVPAQRSIDLAAARPDLVQLETWQVARHCKEWNVDQQRWERLVEAFVAHDAAPPAQRVQP